MSRKALKTVVESILNVQDQDLHDETITNKDVPEDVGIMLMNCGKIIGCLLYN